MSKIGLMLVNMRKIFFNKFYNYQDFDINYLKPFQSFGAIPLFNSLIILFKFAVGPSFGFY